MKGKRDIIVLIVDGIFVKKIWLMTQTPVLMLLNYIIIPYITKKGFLDAISASWSIKVFLVAVAVVFSNILMSQKYHNIKNKCNPFTKQ